MQQVVQPTVHQRHQVVQQTVARVLHLVVVTVLVKVMLLLLVVVTVH